MVDEATLRKLGSDIVSRLRGYLCAAMIHLLIALAIIIGVIWAFVVFPSFRIVVGILVLIAGGLIFVANQNATEEQKKSEIKKEQERVVCEAKMWVHPDEER